MESAELVKAYFWKEPLDEFPHNMFVNVANHVLTAIKQNEFEILEGVKNNYGQLLSRDSSMLEYLNEISKKYFKRGLK